MRATLTRRLRHGAKLLRLNRLWKSSQHSIVSSVKRHDSTILNSCIIIQTFSTERRRDVSERKKKQVAFSQEYKCASCGMMLPPDYAIDHIVPIALGGHNGFRNLQALCLKCHKLKTQSDISKIREAGLFERKPRATPPSPQSPPPTRPKLNEEQIEAVRFDPNRSARVVAGPGTGKTAVLTERVARLVKESHTNARKILVLTFTNRAAHEMRERISNLLTPSQAEEITMGTFHSICLSVLRSHIQHVEVEAPNSTFVRPYRRGFGVYDEADSLKVIRGILSELGWKGEEHSPRFYQTAITSAKNKGIATASEYMRAESSSHAILTVFAEYEKTLRSRNQIDYDDMLFLTSTLFRTNQSILERFQNRWSHVHVDEFQDTNAQQFEFIRLLALPSFVVGDQDQSIYGFRGCEPVSLMSEFDQAFRPDVFHLKRNYRSRQRILDAAFNLIVHNDSSSTTRHRLLGVEDDDCDEHVNVVSVTNELEEAKYITNTILQIQTHDTGDIGVLMRTNAQFRAIERELIRNKINHVIINGTRFFDRREVRDVVAYSKILLNPNDDLSLERIINVPRRNVGDKTLLSIRNVANDRNISMWSALEEHMDEIKSKSKTLQPFVNTMTRLRDESENMSLSEAIVEMLREIGYETYCRDEMDSGKQRWAHVRELVNSASRFKFTDAQSWLDEVALLSDPETWSSTDVRREHSDSDENIVKLMTIHQSKGNEFSHVFVAGVEEDLLPHHYALIGEYDDRSNDVEEERRCMYVALTRAKESAHLTTTRERMTWGRTRDMDPSRFLGEIAGGWGGTGVSWKWFSDHDYDNTGYNYN